MAVNGAQLVINKYMNRLSATVAYRVTHLSRNSEDVGSIPGTGRYIVARMTT